MCALFMWNVNSTVFTKTCIKLQIFCESAQKLATGICRKNFWVYKICYNWAFTPSTFGKIRVFFYEECVMRTKNKNHYCSTRVYKVPKENSLYLHHTYGVYNYFLKLSNCQKKWGYNSCIFKLWMANTTSHMLQMMVATIMPQDHTNVPCPIWK